MRILLICEESPEAVELQSRLRGCGYAVDRVEPAAAAERAASGGYDAIVAGEPGTPMDRAVRVTRRLREADVGEPLLIVADGAGEAQVVEAFDAGADQVMDAQRGCDEFVARVRGLLRQCHATVGDTLSYGEVAMDLTQMAATRQGKVLELLGKPFALLEYFVRNPERVCDRHTIGRGVWNQEFDADSNVIDVTISKLRQQLDKPFECPYLHTVVGKGYYFGSNPPWQAEPCG